MQNHKNIFQSITSINLVWLMLFCASNSVASERVEFNQITLVKTKNILTIQHKSKKLKKIEIIGELKFWPWFVVGDNGVISAGNKDINTKTGEVTVVASNKGALSIGNGFILEIMGSNRLQLTKGGDSCRVNISNFGSFEAGVSILDLLRLGHLYIASADTYLVALTKNIDNYDSSEYRTSRIDFPSCEVTSANKLEDQDYFAEIGWTKNGGWWLVGSIEQTLLRSDNGLKWSEVNIPKNTNALLGAYPKTANEIWIAARIDPARAGMGPMLAKTDDGGLTWREVTFQSKDLKGLPYYWLEGRLRGRSIQLGNTN